MRPQTGSDTSHAERTHRNPSDPHSALFVHALGRSGADAWPVQASADRLGERVFMTRRGFDGEGDVPPEYLFDEEADLVGDSARGVDLVAHSWSGVVALLAAIRFPSRFESVVLCEPAVVTLALDSAAVRRHITEMKPAYGLGLSLEEFGKRFADGLGCEDDPLRWDEEKREAMERLRRHQPPWDTPLDEDTFMSLEVRTLVVTTRSAPPTMYHEIAERMSGHALVEHVVIDGPPHRPQDSNDFNDLLRAWWYTGRTRA